MRSAHSFRSSARLVLALVAHVAPFALVARGGAESAAEDADAIGSTSSAQTVVIDQSGTDVQVLQVWTPGKVFPNPAPAWSSSGPQDLQLDAAAGTDCVRLNSRETATWNSRDLDCTDAFVTKAAWPGSPKSPAFNALRWNVTTNVQSRQSFTDPDFCQLVELRTVTKDASLAAPSFAGIGFHTSRAPSFVPKSDLHAVGHVTLKSGEAATVHRFVGISTCISGAHNSTSGNTYQTFDFKPYARFDLSPGEGDASFRVWESINGNHRLGRSWPGSQPAVNSLEFNREDELLQK